MELPVYRKKWSTLEFSGSVGAACEVSGDSNGARNINNKNHIARNMLSGRPANMTPIFNKNLIYF